MKSGHAISAALVPVLIALWAGPPEAAGFRRAAMGDGGGSHIDKNIIVREVRVTPVRAHVGDVIRIEMTVENHGDLYYDNVNAEVLANRKVVVRKLESYGLGGEGGRIRTDTFYWDTHGVRAGEYRITGQVFVWGDSSPFDNSLEVKEPVVLVPAGAEFPGRTAAGGSAVERDPRFHRSGFTNGSGDSGSGSGGGGY